MWTRSRVWRLLERIRDLVAAASLNPADDELAAVTMSIGIAIARNPVPLAALVEAADRALYRAKSGGKNRVSS
jgi:diguanylate cyclase (GGDEF)-like protein